MDYFAYLVANRASSTETFKIRKVYINEDPNHEETGPCPSCMARNQSSRVRYMFVNLLEAIYKCEAPNCMYPFQNFKFKNYTDNTVYFYTSVEEAPTLDDLVPTFTNVSSPVKCKIEESASMTGSSFADFSLHFFSPERCLNSPLKATGQTSDHNSSLNVFDSPSLTYKSLVQDFDTGFIDDILQDLGQPSPEKPKPVLINPARGLDAKSATSGRQLKRCLQMFKETAAPSEVTFKVPPVPGSEVPIPPKIKTKKHSPLRRPKHSRRTPYPGGGPSSDKCPKKRKMKPLEFIETINSIHPKDASPVDPKQSGVKPLSNQKVENMLNFIERSMKNRQQKPTTTVCPSPVPSLSRHSAKPPDESRRRSKKTSKRMSLSAAVLNDRQFEYSTSESEQEDAPEMVVSAPRRESASIIGGSPESTASSEQSSDADQSLPSFEDLLLHIHPGESKPALPNISLVGFRSAGSSPTRVPQWAKTPPRRIHSMESLCSLLE